MICMTWHGDIMHYESYYNKHHDSLVFLNKNSLLVRRLLIPYNEQNYITIEVLVGYVQRS